MSEFEKQKNNIAVQLKSLCAHCANEVEHNCKIRTFFVDVKSAKNNKPYLKITESSISKEGEKKKVI
jgi:hypothetical protein